MFSFLMGWGDYANCVLLLTTMANEIFSVYFQKKSSNSWIQKFVRKEYFFKTVQYFPAHMHQDLPCLHEEDFMISVLLCIAELVMVRWCIVICQVVTGNWYLMIVYTYRNWQNHFLRKRCARSFPYSDVRNCLIQITLNYSFFVLENNYQFSITK